MKKAKEINKIFKFKYCWVSHEKIYLGDRGNKTYILDQGELINILNQLKLKATLQRKNYKLGLGE